MRYLIIAIIVCAATGAPALADDYNIGNTIGTVFTAGTSIAAGGKATAVVEIGMAATHGLDYGITTTGTINISGALTYSTSKLAATSANWGAALAGATYTTSISITASPRIYPITIAPARYMRLELTNNDISPTTLSWFRIWKR